MTQKKEFKFDDSEEFFEDDWEADAEVLDSPQNEDDDSSTFDKDDDDDDDYLIGPWT